MTALRQAHTRAQRLGVWVTVGLLLAACNSTPGAQRLRITNGGASAIEGLTVIFPEDRVEFGDVPAGATTDYREVPNGVYGYAAYQLAVDGQPVTQPVIDWVGEEPLDGQAFTYTLEADPGRPQLQRVQLIDVTQDE